MGLGLGLKSCVAVYLVELVRLLLQYKWGTIFRSEWFWRMEEVTKRNNKGAWMREIEKCLRRFDASLEWFLERVNLRDEEMNTIRQNGEMEVGEKNERMRMKLKSIDEVLEEVSVLIDTHFYNEYEGTESTCFLKKVVSNQSLIDTRLKMTWRSLNCSPKTMKVIRKIQENRLCVEKRKELITKQRAETVCWCSKSRLPLNSKHVISCCKKVNGEITALHDIVVNILLNNTLVQRGLMPMNRSGRI